MALKNLETPLTAAEEEALAIAAQQLSLNPQAWDKIIEPELMNMVQANQALAKQFPAIKTQLDNLSNIPSYLIPTPEEIDAVVPITATQPKIRPIPKINPEDLKSNEIPNMAIRVFSTPQTSTKVKQLNRLEQLWQFLNQPLN